MMPTPVSSSMSAKPSTGSESSVEKGKAEHGEDMDEDTEDGGKSGSSASESASSASSNAMGYLALVAAAIVSLF
ncbi:hypothetical protein GGI07_005075 [Coemansia sp. Benny D115]|nr:hypothetical protein GGI07_005075 [Coemansia sp. Benny D115]